MRVASVMAALLEGRGGAAGKSALARCFSNGVLRLERSGADAIVVSEEDANFEAKALFALTIARASYQSAGLLDERQAAKALNEKTLPSGFYALTPGASPKIAAAYLPELAGAKRSAAAAFAKRLPALKNAGKAASNCFLTRFEADPEAFALARDPLADYMSVGAGADPERKRELRREAQESSLARFGLRIRTLLPDGEWEAGYPAPLALKGRAVGQAYEPGSLQERRMIREDMSLVSSLAEAGRLPLFNHDAASAINNTRDIQTAQSRAPEREAMVDSMVDAWLAKEAILSGDRDAQLRLGGLSPQQTQELREIAANAEVKAFGKERKLFVGQGKTASHASEDGREHLLLSMDMALVDGQHSSRDYALIAAGCAAGLGEGRASELAPDCAPERLQERVWARYQAHCERSGSDPLGALAPAAMESGRKGAKAAKAGQKESRRRVWEAFARFAPSIPMRVEIASSGDPDMSLLYTMMENAVKEQSAESKALAANRREAQAFVAAFNEAAERAGDPTRIATVKSQHVNPHVSTADRPEEITRDFVDIFPYVRAVINAEKTTAAAHLKPAEIKAARDMARWEALALFESKGVSVSGPEDEDWARLSERLLILILTSQRLRGRDMELSAEKLSKTLAIAAKPESASAKLSAFTATALRSARRFLSALGGRLGPVEQEQSLSLHDQTRSPLTEPQRVYAWGKLALELKDALRPERRAAGNPLSEIMSDASLDNAMLSMLMMKYAFDHVSHPSAPEAAEAFKAARARLQTHAEDAQPAVFARAQEGFKKALAQALEAGAPRPFPQRGAWDEQTRQRAVSESVLLSLPAGRELELLIDAIPGPGLPCAELGARSPRAPRRPMG